MADIPRISVAEARQKVQAHTALLVCAYDDDAKWQKMKLEEAIPLPELAARAATLPKNQEIIFYCG